MPSRRRLLQAVVMSVVGTAGCTTSDDDGTPGGETIADPAVVTVRNSGGERAVTAQTTLAGDKLIRTRRAADGLSPAPGVSTADVTALERFLADTSFNRATVYATQSQLKSCREYRVQSLYWSPRWVEVDSCRRLRPPDAPCAVDRRDAVALFVRIPGAVSRDATVRTGYPSSCPDTEYAVIDGTMTNATATPRGGGDE